MVKKITSLAFFVFIAIYQLAAQVTTQYAATVISYSTQYSTGSWSALQSLGQPNVYPSYGDNSSAWASASGDGQREYLVLGYTTPMQVSNVTIYETYNCGAVDTIYVRNASTGQWNSVWNGTAASTGSSTSRMFSKNFALTSYSVDAVRIAINSPLVNSWNEIDAVSISDGTPSAGTVTVGTPNGGESYTTGQSLPITWTSSGVTGNVNLYYSTDNGSSYTYITNAIASSGSYNWTIPTTIATSSTCKIKVESASNSSIIDESNATFTITSNVSLALTYPNGGENFTVGQTVGITWTSSGLSSYVNLYYSADNGSTWTSIANGTSNNGSYSWLIPTTLNTSSQYKIKVQDYYTSTLVDISNAVFTITNNIAITVVTPNGGETLNSGSTYVISWTKTGGATNSYVYYSTDAGSTWNYITYTNATSYAWTVPSIVTSTTCKIKVEDYGNSLIKDISNANFTINGPSYTVTAPNGGEILNAGQIYNVTWNSTNGSSYVSLYYSLNNGTSWNYITNVNNTGNYVWTVPSVTTSSQCLIKVADNSLSTIYDVSNAAFTINGITYTVTAPNGGEYLVNNSYYTIKWNSSNYGTSNYVYIYYSTNGGSSYTYLTSANNTGTYQWYVPNIQSTTCKVRLTDGNNTVLDESDNVFTIGTGSQTINVTTPNGGQTWKPGTTYNITYSYSAVNNVNIYYSTNGGTNYTLIANTPATGSYNWTIPGGITQSCNALIKVVDAANVNNYDESNAFFCIANPTITVTAPNGGENLIAGQNYVIMWNSTAIANNYYTLEYSTDGGSTWIYITTSFNNYYNWTVPFINTNTQCKVRVSDYYNSATNDASNANFTITNNTAYTVTAPNGGESLNANSYYTITWNKTGGSSTATIYYSTNSGSTWTYIASTTNNGVYQWLVPSVATVSTCKIKVQDGSYSSYNDVSDANFSIVGPSYAVTSPNGGETWNTGDVKNITWTSTNGSNYVTLYYSVNGGSTWTYIASTSNVGNYSWTIPLITTSTTCKIKVEDQTTSSFNDVSDNNFTINNNTAYAITAPNGGESLNANSYYTITWTKTGGSSQVYLYYSIDGGASYSNYITQTSNTGSYSWYVPSILTNTTCKVKVIDAASSTYYDESNANFTIVGPTYTITKPNGGEQVPSGGTYDVKWTNQNTSANAYLYYSTNGGSSYNYATYVTNAGTNTYNWSVPAGINSTTCKLKVVDYNNNNVFDVSDSNFTIGTFVPSITVTSPNGGEYYVQGNTATITYTSYNVVNVNIEYSADNGITWSSIVSSTSATGNYSWSIPMTLANSCNMKIRVTDTGTSGATDVSNATFCIAKPAFTVATPNGGEQWTCGNSYAIQWTATNLPYNYAYVTIDISSDNGLSWNTLAYNVYSYTSGTNTYNWNIPTYYLTAQNCNYKVRVSYTYNNTTYSDVSNAAFCIKPAPPSVRLYSPNGGEQWVANTTQYISWTAVNVPNAKLEYTTDNGTTWKTITNSTPLNTTSYNWTIPNEPSCNSRVRISSSTNSTVRDSSDYLFCIKKPYLTVSTPNGGETYVANTQQYIYWNQVGVTGTVSLAYTTNNGGSWNSIATGIAAGNYYYTWNVPSTYSSYCKVKVTSDVDATITDESNNLFTITKPYIKVNYPNGTEKLDVGSSAYVSWYAPGVNKVNISYSIDNGVSFTSIANNITASTNYYNWTIPNTPSTTCLVKIADTDSVNVLDISDNVFTIPAPQVEVLSPNGYEVWGVNTMHTIQWKAQSVQNVKIEYTTDNGSTWNTIAASVPAYYSYYSWTIPNAPTTTARVKVTAVSMPSVTDESNVNFSIVAPVITVLTPNGGEQWYSFETKTITWNTNGLSNYVTIAYSLNAGATYTTISNSVYNSGSLQWQVPAVTNDITTCKIKVTDATFNSYYDESDANFTIKKAIPSLTLLKPNGGEILNVGTSYPIQFTSVSVDSIDVYFSADNGGSYTKLNTQPIDAQQVYYTWVVPAQYSNNCKIKVQDYLNSAVNDASNSTFTIPAPAITVTSPNGGEQWGINTTHTIYWQSNSVTNVTIEYSLDNGVTFNPIAVNVPNNGYYTWIAPGTVAAQCAIRVSDALNAGLVDYSNAPFSLMAPTLSVIYPNGGDVFTGNTYKYISWNSNFGSNQVLIFLSTDSGLTYSLISPSSGTNNTGSYSWTVPNINATDCFVKVVDYTNSGVLDISDASFEIKQSTPVLTLNNPNGGEQLMVGNYYSISWSSIYLPGVNLEYSTDSGATWNNIAQNISATSGYYYWTVPNSVSTKCLVRISDVGSSLTDVSNATFTIAQPLPSLSLTSPNGGETWSIGSFQYISWSSVLVDSLQIDISINNGATWTTVTNSTPAAAHQYYYNVTTQATTQARVRLTAKNNAALKDSSLSAFTIVLPANNTNTLVVDTISKTTVCKGDTLYVGYLATGTYTAGNTFAVQLSDAVGSFFMPTQIGSLTTTNLSDNIAVIMPVNLSNSTAYQIRVVSSSLPVVSAPYGTSISVSSPEFDFTPTTQQIIYLPSTTINFGITANNPADTVGVNFKWIFGNGDTSYVLAPSYTYSQKGFYTVVLEGKGANGCLSRVQKADLADVEELFDAVNVGNISGGFRLRSVRANASGDTVYAVGDSSLLTSINGGTSWRRINNAPSTQYHGVATAANYTVAVGVNGTINYSTDNGQTWLPATLSSPVFNTLNAVSVYANANGTNVSACVVGENSTIIKWDGTTWSSVTVSGNYNFTGVQVIDNNIAYVVGNNGLIAQLNLQTNILSIISTPVSTNLNAIQFGNAGAAYAVGANGTILGSTNGGSSWSLLLSGLVESFNSVAVDTTNNIVWAVGERGVIYQSAQGGLFDRYSLGSVTEANGIAFNNGIGQIVNADGSAMRFGQRTLNTFVSDTTMCAGRAYKVVAKAGTRFNAGNTFMAQLSDINGDFSSAINIGSLTATTGDTLVVVIPANTVAGNMYRIRIVSTNSAITGNDNTFDITVNAASSTTITADSTNALELTCSIVGTAYQWYTADGHSIVGATTATYTATQAGGYYVVVTNSNDVCTKQSEVYSVRSALGIKTIYVATGVKVNLYPNPNNGTFTLAVNNTNLNKINVSVYTLMGQEVASQLVLLSENTLTTQQFDLSELPSGIYILKLTQDGFVNQSKFVITK